MAFTNQLCVSLVESGVRGDQLGLKAFSPEHFHTWTFIAALLTYLARGRLPFYSDATTRTLGSGGFCRAQPLREHTRESPLTKRAQCRSERRHSLSLFLLDVTLLLACQFFNTYQLPAALAFDCASSVNNMMLVLGVVSNFDALAIWLVD
jgi:hypothetical protein